MTDTIELVRNALADGDWRTAALHLPILIHNGTVCELEALETYEQHVGNQAPGNVRKTLAARLSMLANAQGRFKADTDWFEASRLAEVVREHGLPCRVVGGGLELKAASRMLSGTGRWTWEITYIPANSKSVAAYLGY